LLGGRESDDTSAAFQPGPALGDAAVKLAKVGIGPDRVELERTIGLDHKLAASALEYVFACRGIGLLRNHAAHTKSQARKANEAFHLFEEGHSDCD
jgi:hypothetical protein